MVVPKLFFITEGQQNSQSVRFNHNRIIQHFFMKRNMKSNLKNCSGDTLLSLNLLIRTMNAGN